VAAHLVRLLREPEILTNLITSPKAGFLTVSIQATANGMSRIHILGAAGSGTSTLGAALARRLGVPHTDADTLYWRPTDPPFTTPRPLQERQALLLRKLQFSDPWVLSGAATRWTAPLEPHCHLVVFLRLDPAVRMARLRRREAARFGDRILPDGDMAAIHAAFIAWAESYDTAGSLRHGLLTHETWLADQPAPVLRLDSQAPVEHLVGAIIETLGSLR
jgi:adenylate kinase family enzyme